MPKVNDIKQYWREIATKAGLDKDQLEQVTALIDNDKFAAAINQNFKPLPDYSHDLDDVRNRTKSETQKEYEKWHADEVAKFEHNQRIWNEQNAKIARYQQQFGDITDGNVGGVNGSNGNGSGGQMVNGQYLTKEELEAVLNDRLSRRDQTYLDYVELREQHMRDFGKPLDRKAFEEAYKQHPEWGSIGQAYKSFIEPEAEKAKEDRWKAEADKRYQDGLRDGRTRMAVPTDSGHKQFSPIFDRNEDVAKMTERDQERHSRSAFFEGLTEEKPKQ